jgi:hypothetical protein
LALQKAFLALIACLLLLPLAGVKANKGSDSIARDPGPRPGPPGAGSALESVSKDIGINEFFLRGRADFRRVHSVKGTMREEPGVGLGPYFNNNSCGSCHAQPAVGGTSPSPRAPQVPGPNPQIAVASQDGASNSIPFFIAPDGPVRVALFPYRIVNGHKTTVLDGTVHDLFTIKGREDATDTLGISGKPQTCNLAPDDFDEAARLNNLVFAFRLLYSAPV